MQDALAAKPMFLPDAGRAMSKYAVYLRSLCFLFLHAFTGFVYFLL